MIPRELKEQLTAYLKGEREAFATTLLSGLLMVYGLDLLEWDGPTIEMEVREDFELQIPRRVYDRLMAAITAITTDSVYHDVGVFDQTVASLAGHGVGVEKEAPTAEQLAWTVAELQLLDPEPVGRQAENPWSRQIQKYVRVALDLEGLKFPPKILKFAGKTPLAKDGADDPQMYAGAWGSGQAQADEIDQWLEGRVVLLLRQLMDLGVKFQIEKKAEAPTPRLLLLDELEQLVLHRGVQHAG